VPESAAESKIVYVDNDPLVLAHARALLTSSPEGVCDYIDADLHAPDMIVAEAARTLDFTQPIAVMMLGSFNAPGDAAEPVLRHDGIDGGVGRKNRPLARLALAVIRLQMPSSAHHLPNVSAGQSRWKPLWNSASTSARRYRGLPASLRTSGSRPRRAQAATAAEVTPNR